MAKRKAEDNSNPSSSNLNNDLCELFHELAKLEKNKYKSNAYKKAAQVLAAHPTRIQNGEEAKNLTGIGKSCAEKIDEFLNTGKLRKLDMIRNDESSQVVDLLTTITGIGPSKAMELFNSGIKTLDDLDKIKDKLTHHQQIGLKYFKDFETKIPRSEIKEIEQILFDKIKEIDDKFVTTICGSYRRGKSECEEGINVLVAHPTYTSVEAKENDKILPSKLLKDIVSALENCNLITETISIGHVEFMGVCNLEEISRRLDINLNPHDQYHFGTLFFTGSFEFYQRMSKHAKNKSYQLNRYCLRPFEMKNKEKILGEPIPDLKSEKDIFDKLEYPYKEPNERD